MLKFLQITLILLFAPTFLMSQSILDGGKVSGNFQFDGQYSTKDSLIGATDVPEKVLSNTYLYLNYTSGNFTMGARYEAYRDPILGFDQNWKGNGIAYRFAQFKNETFDVTVGNFYEQFGSGMIFRSYEDRQLGVDYSIDGVKVKMKPLPGITVTGLMGMQRKFWDYGPGIVRGADVGISINELDESLLPSDVQLNLGGSVVSKYQESSSTQYNLPLNVLAWSARANLTAPKFNIESEFAYKNNDPSAANSYSYNPGTGFLLSMSYFPEGIGVNLNFHRVDNMDFRGDRNAKLNNLLINYIPPLTKQHGYALTAMYPYATQLQGEVGLQAEITYTIPKNTFLGGKYGTSLTLNYSRIHDLDTTQKHTITKVGEITYDDVFEYDSPFFKIGERLYFQDINFEISKRWDKSWKSILTFVSQVYDKDILQHGGGGVDGKVYTNAIVADISYKLSNTSTIRTEIQHLWFSQDSTVKEPNNDNGNWMMFLAELTVAPHWYFTAYDQYNYGNDDEARQIHYLNGAVTYINAGTRLSLSYGKQRGGILCVGGVCRAVPAANGFTLSITSSF